MAAIHQFIPWRTTRYKYIQNHTNTKYALSKKKNQSHKQLVYTMASGFQPGKKTVICCPRAPFFGWCGNVSRDERNGRSNGPVLVKIAFLLVKIKLHVFWTKLMLQIHSKSQFYRVVPRSSVSTINPSEIGVRPTNLADKLGHHQW